MLALGRMTMSEFALKLAEEQIGILREALLESKEENAKIKRGIEHIRKQTTEIAIVQMCDMLLTGDQDG